jgi:hypothetical protein
MLAQGHGIDRTALADTVYKGISLGLPSFVEALSWVVFAKAFQYVPATDTLRGWNVRCAPAPLEAPVRYRTKRDGSIATFGPYTVREIRESDARPRPYRDGLMIDYSMDGRARGPMARLRDPIVAIERDAVDVLLGWIEERNVATPCGNRSIDALETPSMLATPVAAVTCLCVHSRA